MQSEGSFPEEHRSRRPPPSTSSPCPAWFFRLRSPFFRGSKTAVQKRLAPLQLLALVQLAQKRPPDVQPNAPLLPISQSPPARRSMREFLRQILPASPAPQNPQNPFQHTAVLDPRTTALALFGGLGSKGAIFFHCASVSNGPDRAIGPPSALLTFLISHFRILNHSHFNGLFKVVQQLLRGTEVTGHGQSNRDECSTRPCACGPDRRALASSDPLRTLRSPTQGAIQCFEALRSRHLPEDSYPVSAPA